MQLEISFNSFIGRETRGNSTGTHSEDVIRMRMPTID